MNLIFNFYRIVSRYITKIRELLRKQRFLLTYIMKFQRNTPQVASVALYKGCRIQISVTIEAHSRCVSYPNYNNYLKALYR